MSVEYGVFARLVTRCEEIVREPGAPQVLIAVYERASEQPLARFLSTMSAVDDATTRASNATTGVERVLEEMDRQFRIGRSTVGAILPDTTLPDTLKRQPTDTDKRMAIQRLVDLITPHAGQPWADALLQGDFGAKAAETLQQLDRVIEAHNALQKAKTERSQSFQAAWGAYVSFKRLVRDTLGATSRQYHRIHSRGASAAKEEAPADTEPTPPPSTPAPARADRPRARAREHEVTDARWAEGFTKGKTAGFAEGEAAGVARAKAEAVIAILAARGIAVSDEDRARVAACKDAATLDRRIAHATSAASVEEVLGAAAEQQG